MGNGVDGSILNRNPEFLAEHDAGIDHPSDMVSGSRSTDSPLARPLARSPPAGRHWINAIVVQPM